MTPPGRPIGPQRYETFTQRVRRHRRIDVIRTVGALNAGLTQAAFGQGPPLGLPNVVTPFGLAGVARAALAVGNDHRNLAVTVGDIIEMCALYANVEEPALKDSGSLQVRRLMNRIAYEQFGHQFSPMENIGRTLVLLADHAHHDPRAPSASQWESALGVTLEEFIRIGFALHVAATTNKGAIGESVLREERFRPVFTPLDPDQVFACVHEWFSANLDDLRAAAAADEEPGLEKWSLNPLVNRPVVRLGDDLIVPWSQYVLDRVTPTGLYFVGLEVFGRQFPDALGKTFEAYVGTQLGLLEHATVIGEIEYEPSKLTVDYFVVTDAAVILVEVKSARPVRSTRLGDPAGDEDTEKKVGHAFEQIDRSANLLRGQHPSLSSIPTDRPIIGVVVTLEPFHLVNTDWYRDVLFRPSVPTYVASAHELEGLVAVLMNRADAGDRILNALTGGSPAMPTTLSAAEKDLPQVANPLLSAAWDRFSRPWSEARQDESQEPDDNLRAQG